MTVAPSTRSLRITVSKDGLEAHLLVNRVDPREVTREALLAQLRQAQVALNSETESLVSAALERARGGDLGNEPILLAHGKPPEPGVGASFELTALPESASSEPDEQGSIDFHRSQIVTVNADEIIGRYIPEKPAVAGVDVFGNKIPATRPLRNVRLGQNVTFDSDGATIRAKVGGKVHINSSLVDVLPVVEINSDVDFSTGNLDAPNDVLIRGTVRETFQVTAAASLTVFKAIEASQVTAGGDVQVNGGIAAQNKGSVTAGGEIFTKFCSEARLTAKSHITITRQALNSQIHTRGMLNMERGALIGGFAFAHCGAVCKTVGSDADVRTVVAIGVDPADLAQANEIDSQLAKKREAIQKIRTTVKPLMDQLKRLTAQQRERATELMFQADEMEMQVLEQEKEKHRLLALPEEVREVAVEVGRELFPGTRVIVGNKMVNFRKGRQGHFKICRRVVDRQDQIVIIDLLTGSVSPQHTFEFNPDRDLNPDAVKSR